MSHRSGLVREPPLGHYFDPAPPKLIDVVRSLASTSLVFEPGTRTKYSNAGVAVVGAVVERVRRRAVRPRRSNTRCSSRFRMSRSSFEPGPKLVEQMASGLMWTYDGQSIATPTFLLGTGPAGNLVSTVVGSGSFRSSFLLADGRGPSGPIVKPRHSKLMTEPQLGKPGESPRSALASHFRSSTITDGSATAGRSMASQPSWSVYPTPSWEPLSSRAWTVPTASPEHIAETALRQVLAVREGRPLPVLETTDPIPRERAHKLEGRLHQRRQGNQFHRASWQVVPERAVTGPEVRALGDALVVDDRLVHGLKLTLGGQSSHPWRA